MTDSLSRINVIKDRVFAGLRVAWQEGLFLIGLEKDKEIEFLCQAADEIRKHFSSDKADLCSLINAKSGCCSEDCAFCSQSARYGTEARSYPLVSEDEIVNAANRAYENGAHRFCVVTSGRSPDDNEFDSILSALRRIRKTNDIALDCSLGFLRDERMSALKQAGASRVNHNLETSADYYPSIVTTHSYEDRVSTVKRLKQAGFEVCSGGILGMGESREDRLKLAFKLRELEVNCVPLNILNPRKGTPLESQLKLSCNEIVKTIACFRFIIPSATIKLAGGREVNLGPDQERALRSGANGVIIGGYLTTAGSPVEEDLALIKRAGFSLS